MTDVALDEIMAELEVEEVPCPRCSRPMVSLTQWVAADTAERDELRAEGYVRPGARGVCGPCARTMPREEYLALPKSVPGPKGSGVSTLEMVKDVAAHLAGGGALADVVSRYPDRKPDSIRRALERARARGDVQ